MPVTNFNKECCYLCWLLSALVSLDVLCSKVRCWNLLFSVARMFYCISTVCMPCIYGTASYNFCLLQVMHRIDLPSVIFLITHTQWTRVPSIVLESTQEILNYNKQMIAAQLLSTFLCQFLSLEALNGRSMWVHNLYFISRRVILTVFSLSMILVHR